MAKKNITQTTVESIRHKDKRADIPTEELRDFVAEDEQTPKTMLYPRDLNRTTSLISLSYPRPISSPAIKSGNKSPASGNYYL